MKKELHPILLFIFPLSIFFAFNGCGDNSSKIYTGDFEGRIEWDSTNFQVLPKTSPLRLTLETKEDTFKSDRFLDMKFALHNSSKDTVYVTCAAHDEVTYNFVITTINKTRIWSLIQSNVRGMAQRLITLAPGEEKIFNEKWNYKNFSDRKVDDGKYLIYAVLEGVSLKNKNFSTTIEEYGNIGVGPDTLYAKSFN